MLDIPSSAVAFVGRHNSGKTTLIEKVIAELVSRGLDVGSIKHHSHTGFDIDYPGKDSYRHRQAGARDVIIAAPGQLARMTSIEGEMECSDIVRFMPNHDIIIVEGYRRSGLPTLEIMRADNPRDVEAAREFAQNVSAGFPLGYVGKDSNGKLPTDTTVGLVSDIPEALEAADALGLRTFDVNDVKGISDYVQKHFARPAFSVVIQAGGESKRMGQSKALVPFLGRPLICRLIERLAPVADELIITTNEPERLEFVHELYPELNIALVVDKIPGRRGALPGLYTALSSASKAYVAVVACDMVFASAALIVAQAQAMRRTYADVVVPVNKHGFEPFHAMYYRKKCLPAIETALERGESKAQSFFDAVEVFEFAQDEVLAAEPKGGCFINANTPDELHALEERVQVDVK